MEPENTPTPAPSTPAPSTPARSITIYVADVYGHGCPSNAAGRRIGVGFTAKRAIESCEPWANQGPWFRRRARRVLVVDGFSLAPRDEHAVWCLLTDDGFRRDPDLDRLATALLAARDKLAASASTKGA